MQRPLASSIPDAPGSYQFYDDRDRILYVGKAKSLRHRLSNYFADPATLAPRTAAMMAEADRVEWLVVATELEALMLEYSLIQTLQPRFNVRLKDDKSYPWLAVTVSEEWPRPAVVRGRKRKGVRYFGPYGHAGAIRDTLDLLLRSFPVRTCSDTKFRRHERLGRPCLLFHIDRCSGPCVGAVEPERYQEMVNDLMGFLSGDMAPIVGRLEAEMAEASDALEFERAARLRDRLAAVAKAAESQQMALDRPEDLDVIGLADDELEAAVVVFHVRKGRVTGRSGFVADKVEDLSTPELISTVLGQLYGGREVEIPRRILVPVLPDDAEIITSWLRELRTGPVDLTVPQRGAKRELQATVARNAREDLTRHHLKRSSDHNARSKALTELQQVLSLDRAPLRIECFDMSHLQGTNYVGSMVVFEDALAKKSDYRRFAVKTVPGNDDYAAMEEVLRRRLVYLGEQLDRRKRPVVAEDDTEDLGPTKRPTRFAYPPDLLLIDGGLGQLNVGLRVVRELGLEGRFELAAIAKSFEEIYRPGVEEPVRIARGSEALYLLQRVRDEAHRFAITFHREKRNKSMTTSVLDGVPGLGEGRRKRLLKEFGGIRALRQASLDDLLAVSWLPESVARALDDQLEHLGSPRIPAKAGKSS